MKLDRLDHVAILTTDPARGEAFYCELLGFRPTVRPKFSFDGRWLVRENLGVMLHLIHRDDYQAFDSDGATLNNHLAFSSSDIDEVTERLNSLQIPFVERELPNLGYRQIFFRDPDGNLLEIGEWPEDYLSELEQALQ